MHCKWCGMESKDDKRCEWCGRPFVAPANGQPINGQPTTVVPPMTTVVPSVTTAVPQATTVMPPVANNTPPPPGYGPATSVMNDPRVAAAAGPSLLAARVDIDPFGMRLEKYLGIMLILLAAGMAFAHYKPDLWYAAFYPLLFVSGILMGSLRVIGYFDDEYADATILLGITAFFGPVYATLAYLVIALIRQDFNTSMLGLMASYFVLRIAIGGAAHGMADTLSYMTTFYICLNFLGWALMLFPLCMLFGGWMSASFSRPLNE